MILMSAILLFLLHQLHLICISLYHLHTGVPTREFLHLIVSNILRKTSLFCGPTTARIPAYNMSELAKQTYKHVGSILAISIICGGSAPGFFTEPVADYVAYGFNMVWAMVADIPDPFVKEKVSKVCI